MLVLTYESAEYMARTDFGFGVGIVPVRYTDHPSFGGDYTLYLQIQCAASYEDSTGICPSEPAPLPVPPVELPPGQGTPRQPASGQPGPAVSNARFRITINGLKVNRQSLDDALQRDGRGDEVYFLSQWRMTEGERTIRSSELLRSRVMGDAHGRSDRVWAGSARPGVLMPGVGGLLTGDPFPNDPTVLSGTPTTDRAPMLLFEGEMTSSQLLVVVPTVWEQDGPDDLLTTVGRALNPVLDNGARSVTPPPQYPGLLGRILATEGDLGSDVRVGLGVFGDPRDRPIGMTLQRENYAFFPQRLRFNLADAIEASRTNFGYGAGVVPITYVDANALRGSYTIFVQISRL